MLPQNKSIQEIPIIYFVGEAAEEKQQAKAKLSREDTLKLDSKQLTSTTTCHRLADGPTLSSTSASESPVLRGQGHF